MKFSRQESFGFSPEVVMGYVSFNLRNFVILWLSSFGLDRDLGVQLFSFLISSERNEQTTQQTSIQIYPISCDCGWLPIEVYSK